MTRRSEPQLVAVPMTDEQQQLYGWLGLSPALLLEEPPEAENVMVRVVRPGEDAEAVLEEARQQLAANSNRRRRRGRGGRGTGRNGSGSSTPETASSVVAPPVPIEPQVPLMVEITPLEVTPPVVETPIPVDSEDAESAAMTTTQSNEVDEPRRRRRRSSAVTV